MFYVVIFITLFEDITEFFDDVRRTQSDRPGFVQQLIRATIKRYGVNILHQGLSENAEWRLDGYFCAGFCQLNMHLPSVDAHSTFASDTKRSRRFCQIQFSDAP